MKYVLVIALLLATFPPGGTFIDDDGDIHEPNIEAIAAAGITVGCNPPTNTRFCPTDPVTRAQMASFLARALDLPTAETDHFTDDAGSVHHADINRLAAARITVGCGAGRFCPDQHMTRGEMAAMLARAFAYPTGADHFVDDNGHMFEREINRIAAAGVTRGCNPPHNDRFCPDTPVSRAEMATFLTRTLGLIPLHPPARPHPVVEVQSRQGWGAHTAQTDRMVSHDINRLTIHHAGTQTGTTGPAQFRGWQNWHQVGQGWPDIAYHLIIGVDGTVYEGRDPAYRGDTATTYDTTGHFLVVVEGNFDLDQPTEAQLDSLRSVLAWAAGEYGVAPSTISGHGDHAATSCPGLHLRDRIHSSQLEREVQALIDSGGIELLWPAMR